MADLVSVNVERSLSSPPVRRADVATLLDPDAPADEVRAAMVRIAAVIGSPYWRRRRRPRVDDTA